MLTWHAIWRGALARALFIATSLTATPAVACPRLGIEDLARQLPRADRFEFEAPQLRPFLALWQEHRGVALPERPDGVALFATKGQPLLIAFRRAGCLIAALPAQPAELWQAMRRHIGPIA
jgi:hypothetical protein